MLDWQAADDAVLATARRADWLRRVRRLLARHGSAASEAAVDSKDRERRGDYFDLYREIYELAIFLELDVARESTVARLTLRWEAAVERAAGQSWLPYRCELPMCMKETGDAWRCTVCGELETTRAWDLESVTESDVVRVEAAVQKFWAMG
jgi:hypothetical protein